MSYFSGGGNDSGSTYSSSGGGDRSGGGSGLDHNLYSGSFFDKIGEFAAIIILIGFWVGCAVKSVPGVMAMFPDSGMKLEYDSPDYHIENYSGFLDDTQELEQILRNIQDKTGVCPVVEFCGEDWQDPYWIFSEYAENRYKEKFNDEQHFLLLYTQSDAKRRKFDWAVVQGDKTGTYVSSDSFYTFQSGFQALLEDRNNTLDTAMISVFRELDASVDMTKFDVRRGLNQAGGEILFTIISIPFIILGIKYLRKRKAERNNSYAFCSGGGSMVPRQVNTRQYGNSNNFGHNSVSGNGYGSNMTNGYQNNINPYNGPQNRNGYGNVPGNGYQNYNGYGNNMNNGINNAGVNRNRRSR